MKKEYILFIDSGIGGLSTLKETSVAFPFNYIYFADSKNAPYGSHSKSELFEYLYDIIEFYTEKYKIRIVVLACNTATACCVSLLRKKYTKLTVIGTEPAIKLAEKQHYFNILSLTTPATAKQYKYFKLKQSLKSNVKSFAMPDFAKNVEEYFIKKTKFSYINVLKNVMFSLNAAKKQSCIVLGCTHYVFVKDIFKKFTNKCVVDGNKGVSKQVVKVCETLGVQKLKKSSILFECSNSTNFAKENYKKILSQILAKL